LEKAYHTKNGPLFVRTVDAISTYFGTIKNEMMANARNFFNTSSSESLGLKEEHEGDPTGKETPSPVGGGVPVRLWKTIMEEVYQRSVGPDVDETKKYKSFSSETYGELNPMYVV
jgi:[histone H3]-lysine79 N-trimethyltransferase